MAEARRTRAPRRKGRGRIDAAVDAKFLANVANPRLWFQ